MSNEITARCLFPDGVIKSIPLTQGHYSWTPTLDPAWVFVACVSGPVPYVAFPMPEQTEDAG